MNIPNTIFFVLVLMSSALRAEQDTVSSLRDYLHVYGYIEDMQISSFGSGLDTVYSDNLLHNRINIRAYPAESFTLGLELRNRVYWGETVKNTPDMATTLRHDNGYVNMSWLAVHTPSVLALMQVDRLWLEYNSGSVDLVIGRQRVNWGINNYWNANDLFNAYYFVDFDYEERPGSDALRCQYQLGDLSSTEIAIKPGRDSSDWIAAGMFRFNEWQYDFQTLAAWWHQELALGAGWAGNIGDAGCKGEATFFHPVLSSDPSSNVLSASISFDYAFVNTLYCNLGFLVNSGGADHIENIDSALFEYTPSAKSLMPVKYSALLNLSYTFSPLLNGALYTIVIPGADAFFVMPNLSLSLAANWDLALYDQSLFVNTNAVTHSENRVYLRLKGSF